jgi:hypothetical protein
LIEAALIVLAFYRLGGDPTTVFLSDDRGPKTGVPMSIPQQSHLRDVALAAIAQAHRQMGAGENLVQVDETDFKLEEEKIATHHPSDEQPRLAEPGRGSSRGRLVLWSLMGLLACIGVAAFAWPSRHGQAAPEPTSTSSVSIEKKEPPPAPSNAGAKTDAGLPQRSSQAQTTIQRAAPVAPTAAPMAPDLAQSIQMITRELANLEQGIDQLKTGQAQMVRDNAELAEHFKATQEMARNNADLAEQLKASREQMATIAEQLKQSQAQTARLVASEQNQRPRTLASSPTTNSTRKLVPKRPSPRVRVQTQDPTPLQPEPQ